jgi:general stress protein CsbA
VAQFPIAIRGLAVSFTRLTMKIWAALVLIPILLFVTGCEEHPVSDLQKVDTEYAAEHSK